MVGSDASCSASRAVCLKFGYVHGLGPPDAHTDIQDRVKLLRHDATNTKHPTVRDKTSTSVTSGVLSLEAVGLQQCDTGWPTTDTTGQIALRAQCCGTSGVLIEEI